MVVAPCMDCSTRQAWRNTIACAIAAASLTLKPCFPPSLTATMTASSTTPILSNSTCKTMTMVAAVSACILKGYIALRVYGFWNRRHDSTQDWRPHVSTTNDPACSCAITLTP
ncbi:MAG: TRAP transporter large permease subunit [Planctomycetota bacterium]|nr:MAG: TRAP transporter large permease subunit [Planctomycetota bacterium]